MTSNTSIRMEITRNIWKYGQKSRKGRDKLARLELSGFDEIEKMFEAVGKPEEFAIKAVNKAAPVLERCTRKAVKESSNSDKLATSFSMTPAKENDLGVYSVIRPTGDFNKDLSNADLAAQFEYGRKGGYKKGDMKRAATEMRPRPWRDRALNSARAECESIAEQEVYRAIDEVVG